MKKYLFLFLIFTVLFFSCRKKHLPTITPVVTTNTTTTESIAKAEAKKSRSAVLDLNDKYAKKMLDGRLYFDIDGVRYWKNFDDGKYYRFNKTMYQNPSFKPR